MSTDASLLRTMEVFGAYFKTSPEAYYQQESYRLIHPYLDGTRAKSRYRNKPAVGETSSNGTTGDMNEDVVFDIGKM